MVAKTITRKKHPKIVNKELLSSLRESDTVEKREFNIHNTINKGEAIDIIKHYKRIMMMGNKKQ